MSQRQHQNTATERQAQGDRVALQMDLTRGEVEALHALLTEAEHRGELPEALRGVWRALKWVQAYERWREGGGDWPFGPDFSPRGDS